MSALTYTSLQTELLVALALSPPPYNTIPPDFVVLFPQAISYAEGRICAEIPLLANRAQDVSLTTTPNARRLALTMTPPVVVQESFSLIVAGVHYAFDKTTLDFIDMFWPVQATAMNPANADNIGRWWAPLDAANIVMAPTPDAAYTAECTGLFQPVALSSGNPSTYLSATYPQLLTAACMVWLEGAMKRNFGASADDPKSAMSWEMAYSALRDAASYEESRRRGLTVDIPRAPAAAPAT